MRTGPRLIDIGMEVARSSSVESGRGYRKVGQVLQCGVDTKGSWLLNWLLPCVTKSSSREALQCIRSRLDVQKLLRLIHSLNRRESTSTNAA